MKIKKFKFTYMIVSCWSETLSFKGDNPFRLLLWIPRKAVKFFVLGLFLLFALPSGGTQGGAM